MGVLVSGESSTATSMLAHPRDDQELGKFQTFRLFRNPSTCSMWEWRGSAADGGPEDEEQDEEVTPPPELRVTWTFPAE